MTFLKCFYKSIEIESVGKKEVGTVGKGNMRDPCVMELFWILTVTVDILALLLYYCFVRYYHWWKLDKAYRRSPCIISYNCIWIYDFIKIKSLSKKKCLGVKDMARDCRKIATLTLGQFTEYTESIEHSGWIIFLVLGPIILGLGGVVWLSCRRPHPFLTHVNVWCLLQRHINKIKEWQT